MVTPEDNRRIVFSNGMLRGSNGEIINGGHICPSSGVGEMLL
jgi:hypothetical protein